MAENKKLNSDDPFADTGTTDIGATDLTDVVDFGEIDDNPLVPAIDDVLCKIVHAEAGRSKAGHPKIDVRWKIIDEESPYHGRQIFDSFSFSPNAVGITKRRLKQLGMPDSYKASLPELCSAYLLNAEARVSIKIQPKSVGGDGKEYDERNAIGKIIELLSSPATEPAF